VAVPAELSDAERKSVESLGDLMKGDALREAALWSRADQGVR
jgi:hypothetical protein